MMQALLTLSNGASSGIAAAAQPEAGPIFDSTEDFARLLVADEGEGMLVVDKVTQDLAGPLVSDLPTGARFWALVPAPGIVLDDTAVRLADSLTGWPAEPLHEESAWAAEPVEGQAAGRFVVPEAWSLLPSLPLPVPTGLPALPASRAMPVLIEDRPAPTDTPVAGMSASAPTVEVLDPATAVPDAKPTDAPAKAEAGFSARGRWSAPNLTDAPKTALPNANRTAYREDTGRPVRAFRDPEPSACPHLDEISVRSNTDPAVAVTRIQLQQGYPIGDLQAELADAAEDLGPLMGTTRIDRQEGLPPIPDPDLPARYGLPAVSLWETAFTVFPRVGTPGDPFATAGTDLLAPPPMAVTSAENVAPPPMPNPDARPIPDRSLPSISAEVTRPAEEPVPVETREVEPVLLTKDASSRLPMPTSGVTIAEALTTGLASLLTERFPEGLTTFLPLGWQAPPSAPQATPAFPGHAAAAVAAKVVAELANPKPGVTEISLSPEELGRVNLSLQADAQNPDRMVLMLAFDRPETMDLFRRHADQLAEVIRSAGYSGVDIGFVGSSRVDLQACKLEYSIVSPK